MSDLSGVKVGDELIYKTQSRYRDDEVVTVTKVGRKLLTVAREGYEMRDKFRIENGRSNGDYAYGWLTTAEAQAEAIERDQLWKRIHAGGLESRLGAPKGEVSNTKLRAIADILESE